MIKYLVCSNKTNKISNLKSKNRYKKFEHVNIFSCFVLNNGSNFFVNFCNLTTDYEIGYEQSIVMTTINHHICFIRIITKSKLLDCVLDQKKHTRKCIEN